MSEPIVLYYNPMSRARIILWMLEELGEPYRLELLSFDKKEHKSAAYLAINPMGKVPTIIDQGTVVTEGAAICTYLADKYPRAKLAPTVNDPARGTYLRWLFFGAGCVEPAIVDRMFSRPEPARPAAIGYGSYQDTMNALEGAITPGPFILGETFSAADVYIASQIGWGMMTKSIEPRPAFQDYLGRTAQRPAFQRFLAASEAAAATLAG